MSNTRRTESVRTTAAGDGLGVFKLVSTDAAGWESPAWYVYRAIEGGFAVGRLGSSRRYAVRIGAAMSCECLGKESGHAACRHIRALQELASRCEL